MATEQQIKDAILKVAGNPDSGPIKALAGDMAKAVAKLDAPEEKALERMKETRITAPCEAR